MEIHRVDDEWDESGPYILVRELCEQIPPGWALNQHYVVEYFEDTISGPMAPLGQAWVVNLRGMGPTISYLFVLDEYRRNGIGSTLVDFCKARWPGLHVQGVTEAGNALIDSLSE